jgi:hypothetical protein
MELVEGETLEHRLIKGPLLPELTIRFAAQIADPEEEGSRDGGGTAKSCSIYPRKGTMMAVPATLGTGFEAGPPLVLFHHAPATTNFCARRVFL